jgi:hypothetical protein
MVLQGILFVVILASDTLLGRFRLQKQVTAVKSEPITCGDSA